MPRYKLLVIYVPALYYMNYRGNLNNIELSSAIMENLKVYI